MKIIPEQSTELIQSRTGLRISLDTASCCFFILGMFLAAFILHSLGIFPIS